MDRSLVAFKDILKERRQEYSNFMWISRHLNPKVAYERLIKPTPKFHKEEVLKSRKIQEVIEKNCKENGALKGQLTKAVMIILDEIGFNKRITIIRRLGLLLTKICLNVYGGIHVNDKIYRIKELMGNKPIIFLPSHRSYADFILMSYLCFTYNIEIPAIAAGMDFHAMWGMGKVLRDTGAFFMRRSFNDDSLYWDTFRQYIYQLITEGDLPLEFFIEGTRSRSGKSLIPKYGLLSMVLKTFYTAAVPDILFVPINISYDRVLEEKLFAYELLGVPKPKESTSGFLKSLSIIKERYGNIYIDFGEPISARSYFGSFIDRSFHSIKPTYMQEFTEREKESTSELANNIVNVQQKCAVITTFNLIALSLTNSFMAGENKLHIKDHIEDVIWINNIVKSLGACTDLLDIEKNIETALDVHKGLVKVTSNDNVALVQNAVALNTSDPAKLKGHTLSQDTMTYSIPFIMLQIYVNPVMHYLADPCLISVIVEQHRNINIDDLFTQFTFFQTLFSHEFVSNYIGNYLKYQDLLKNLTNIRLLSSNKEEKCEIYEVLDFKIYNFFKNLIVPFLYTYYMVCDVLLQNKSAIREKCILVTVQSRFEELISARQKIVHPYSLNLDSITNCLSSFAVMGIIHREKINEDVVWSGNMEKVKEVREKLEPYLASLSSAQNNSNTNIFLASKL